MSDSSDRQFLVPATIGVSLLLLASVVVSWSDFYEFLRWVICGFCVANGFVLNSAFKGRFPKWVVWGFGIIAVLFNPVLPIYLYNKSAWLVIDSIVTVFFITSLTMHWYYLKNAVRKNALPNEARNQPSPSAPTLIPANKAVSDVHVTPKPVNAPLKPSKREPSWTEFGFGKKVRRLYSLKIRVTLEADNLDDAKRKIVDAFRDEKLVVVNTVFYGSSSRSNPETKSTTSENPNRISMLGVFTFEASEESPLPDEVVNKALAKESLKATNYYFVPESPSLVWSKLCSCVAVFRIRHGHFPTFANIGHEAVADLKVNLSDSVWNGLDETLPIRINHSAERDVEVGGDDGSVVRDSEALRYSDASDATDISDAKEAVEGWLGLALS